MQIIKFPGYENYDVYSSGKIVNSNTSRELKIDIGNTGYARITVCKDNKTFRKSVHRVIAELFVFNSDPVNRIFVNHKNGNKLDNRAENLEWVTQAENQKHAYEKGLQPANKQGWEHSASKLSKTQVEEIRGMYVPGKKPTHQTIADRYGVARQTITDLLSGKIYRMDK